MVHAGYSHNTRRTYSSSQRQYLQFCLQYNLQPVPASDLQIRRYIAFLSTRIAPGSIKVYLAAVRALHVNIGLEFHAHLHPLCQVMVRGLVKNGAPPVQKWPITLDILYVLRSVLSNSHDHLMIWAAMTLAFFACLRADEFTVSSESQQAPSLDSIKFKKLSDGRNYITYSVPKSKTEPHGFTRVVGCSKSCVCAYCAMIIYLQARKQMDPQAKSPHLFIDCSSNVLTGKRFNQIVKVLITAVGLDPNHFSGHSFRAGSASSAGARGFKDWEIQLLGGWRSSTYQRYIRHTEVHAVSFAERLISPTVGILC